MTGKRSPWGKPQPEDPGHNDGDDRSGAQTPPSSEGEPPKGPRNPWLPGGNEQPRRSASIEDIFRGRGPSGGPGGGGSFPRLPQRPDGKSWFPLINGQAPGAFPLKQGTMIHGQDQIFYSDRNRWARDLGMGQ